MTESMTSPHSRHFQPKRDSPLVAPTASSNRVGTIKPWQRGQFIVSTPFQKDSGARAAETGKSNASRGIRKREGSDSQRSSKRHAAYYAGKISLSIRIY